MALVTMESTEEAIDGLIVSFVFNLAVQTLSFLSYPFDSQSKTCGDTELFNF